MKKLLIILLMITMGMIPLATFAKEKKELPEYTVEGLKRVSNPEGLAVVYAEPGANLSQYKRIYLVEPYVAFKKNWKRDQNRGVGTRITTADMDRIKKKVSELFMEVFTEELTDGSYALVTERAEDVLIVKPAIIDLDVYAPDTMSAGRSTTYTQSAGSMTLYLELYDSETDDLLAKALDPAADRQNAFMQWQTGPANRAAGKRMMKSWAKALREALDRARKETGEN